MEEGCTGHYVKILGTECYMYTDHGHLKALYFENCLLV